MKGKIAFVLGAAVGYVLGTRAGRERYEQIKQGAQTLWNAPPVQKGVAAARGAVEDRVEQLKESALHAGKEAFGAFVRGSGDARSEAAARSNSSGAAPAPTTGSASAESKSADSKPASSGKPGGGSAGSSGKTAPANARRGGSGSAQGAAKSPSASKSKNKSTTTGSAKKAGDA